MFYYHNDNVPAELLQIASSEDDISILIGENGSGKSTLLNHIAQSFLQDRRNKVIAVANTIHDKFRGKNDKFETLKSSTGRGIVNRALIRCLAILVEEDYKRIGNIESTLRYVGFDPTIAFKLRGLKHNFMAGMNILELPEDVKNQVHTALDMYVHDHRYSMDLARIELNNFSFIRNNVATLLVLFKYEKQLRKAKIISGIDMFLFKGRGPIPIYSASSGELSLIATLLYIASAITHSSVILIDEPENSLHPKWQMEYVKRINELFYLYQPKIIIATHSPLIINGAELQSGFVKIYKGESGDFELQDKDTTNVEEIYEDYFDVTTPQNRYLSELLVKKMNELANQQISFAEFEDTIIELDENAYDPEQKKVLKGLINMGQKIVNAR